MGHCVLNLLLLSMLEFAFVCIAQIPHDKGSDYHNYYAVKEIENVDVTTTGVRIELRKRQEKKVERKAMPNGGIGFVIEGIERSDFGLSLRNSNFQRSRAALGFQKCEDGTAPTDEHSSLVKVFYESQKGPSNYEPEAIRVLCWNQMGGIEHFCACNEDGHCFVPLHLPTYVEVQPYCDPEEGACHAYLELFGGILKSEDDPNIRYWHPFDAGPFGLRSPYMKVSAVSCEGCSRLRRRNRTSERKCREEFTWDRMDEQKLNKALLLEKNFDGNSKGTAAVEENLIENVGEGKVVPKVPKITTSESSLTNNRSKVSSGGNAQKGGSDQTLCLNFIILFISFILTKGGQK